MKVEDVSLPVWQSLSEGLGNPALMHGNETYFCSNRMTERLQAVEIDFTRLG